MRRTQLVLVAVAAGLALADSSIVALALPPLLDELDTTVTGVAAVIGVYTLVLAAGISPAAALARRLGPGHVGAAGMLVFAAASVGCAVAGDLATLLVLRGVQAAGGAAALIAAFDLMDAGGSDASLGRRLWIGAAVFGTAAGPAIGGALTDLLDWRAIFVAQAPVAAAAAAACWGLRIPPPGAPASAPLRWRAAIALGAISAALTAVLFLLVLELVAGWSVDPLEAALAVSVLPLAALGASRIPGDPHVRAACGCLLVAAGAAALAHLPDARLAWTVGPQVLAGIGMGLAYPALAGGMLPERTSADAERVLVARHVGIVVALAILAPVVSSQLDEVTASARYQGVAVVLDAKMDPIAKIELAPALLDGVDTQDPRGGLEAAVEAQRPRFEGDERAAFERIAERVDDVIVAAVAEAFRPAYLITGGLALLAALVLVLGARVRLAAIGATAAVAAAAVAGAVALDRERRPEPVVIADPCHDRETPGSGGVLGFLQDRALELLDRAACEYGSTREELVLALADDAEHERFKRVYGVDPRSARGILDGLFG
ncbi:MAG: MFS transporter [Solirubrobacteraceae bacterium]|nr:MFS transporter [Solirubrobacteraceae bacterium]